MLWRQRCHDGEYAPSNLQHLNPSFVAAVYAYLIGGRMHVHGMV
jgi:hypothetical protein